MNACGNRVWSMISPLRPSSAGQIVRYCRPSTRTHLHPAPLDATSLHETGANDIGANADDDNPKPLIEVDPVPPADVYMVSSWQEEREERDRQATGNADFPTGEARDQLVTIRGIVAARRPADCSKVAHSLAATSR